MSDERRELPETTLTEFIENNHKLISTVAILATLSSFANNLPNKEVGKILSFCLFTLALLVCVEIHQNLPLVTKGRLYWFSDVFTISVVVFIVAWIGAYYPYLILFLVMVVELIFAVLVFGLLGTAIRKLILRMPWLKSLSQRTRERSIPGLGALFLMVLVILIIRHFLHF